MVNPRKPKGHPPAMRTVLKPPPRKATPLRPPPARTPVAPIQPDPIQAQLDAQISPMLQALLFERQQKQAYASRQAHDLGGFTQALMGQLGQISPAIAGAFDQASGIQSAMGTGYGGLLNAAQAADAGRINDVLGTIGAPEGQKASGGDAGGVLAGLAGWIPSQMLAQQGQGLSQAAAALPETASIQAQIEMHKLLGQASEQDNAYGEQVKELLAKVPGMRADLQDAAAKQKLAEQKVRLGQINDDRNYWLKTQAYYQSIGKFKLSKQAEHRAQMAEQRYANESAGRDAMGNVAPGYVQMADGTIMKRSDIRSAESSRRSAASARRTAMKDKGLAPDGTVLPGFKKLPNGTVVKVSTARPKAKGAASMTPGQKVDVMTSVMGKEDDIVKKDLPQLAKQTGYADLLAQPNPRPKEVARLQKSMARALWVRYAPVAATPAAKAALRRMISRLVKSYKPGASGLTEGLLP